jgi:hypothetical protein
LFSELATGFARARGPFASTISPEDAETMGLIAELLEFETDEINPFNLPMSV